MLNQTYGTILTTIQSAQHILVVSHRKPDGDTIGSALALRRYCLDQGKTVTNFCIDPIADYLQFLPDAHQVTSDSTIWTQTSIDVIICVDCGDLRYAGVDQLVATMQQPYQLINIDHHVTNPGYGTINFVDATASSACELVFRLLDSVRAINQDIATCLLTGLVTDTGNLTNLATTADAMTVAAQLIAKGANLQKISTQALQHRPVTTLHLWGRALQRLHEDPQTGMVTTALSYADLQDCQVDDEAVSGISNFLNSLDQAANKAVLVLAEVTPGTIKGSLRTTNPLIDVTKFAKLYHGGGHKKAAGFTIQGTLEITPTGYVIHPTTSHESNSNRH